MFRGVNLVREKFFSAFAQVDSGCLHNNFICQPCPLAFCVHPWRFLPCWNCVLRGYNLHFAVVSGCFCAVKELCLASVQFCYVWCFSAAFRGFPRFAFCSRRCGRSAVRYGTVKALFLPFICQSSGGFCPSFDRFRLVRLPSVFACFRRLPSVRGSLLPFAGFRPISCLFRLSGFTFHHIAACVLPSTYRRTLIFDHLRLLAAVVVLYALKWL